MSALIILKCLRPERGVFMEEKLPHKKEVPFSSNQIKGALYAPDISGDVILHHWVKVVSTRSQHCEDLFMFPFHALSLVSHSSSSHSRGGKVIGTNSNCPIKKICPFPHIYLFVYSSILLWNHGYLLCFLNYNAALILFMYLLKLFQFDH